MKIRTVGKVRSVSDPFRMDCTSSHNSITVETEKGIFSLPVEDASLYVLNQNVKITVTIEAIDG